MAVLKLSQIVLAGAAPALTDTVIGVTGGTTDNQFTVAQLQTATTASGLGTAGSVFFAGAGGSLAQDNTKFFWDDTNFILKAGTRFQQLVNGVFVNALYPVYNASGDNWFI